MLCHHHKYVNHCLLWARENRCPWSSYTCSNAALNGHLDCLQWARETDVHRIVIHVVMQLRIVIYTVFNGLEIMGVTGVYIHVVMQLRMVTWTVFNELERMDAHRLVIHVLILLRMDTWIAFNGLKRMDVHMNSIF